MPRWNDLLLEANAVSFSYIKRMQTKLDYSENQFSL